MTYIESQGATAPTSVTELLERLDAETEKLPKRLRQCATFTRGHLHLIAVSTVAEMAEASGVAASAYMRFCQALGFRGYSEMQALFRTQFTEFRPGYEARLAAVDAGGEGIGRLLVDFAESGHKSLLSLANTVTSGTLESTAQGLSRARIIHLVGLRRAFAVASSMSYLFGKMGVASVLHGGSGLLDGSAVIQPGDAVFAITYAPFSPETLSLASEAAERGVPVFGLTDTVECPLADFAQELLVAREDEVGALRALNASITLTTTLAVAVGALR
ncbi:transcriptional regulator, RpiR family [Salipiger thiooxidans]|uniref:Transcriptional regulator, RpiR family n=1 Tax=Salipiger thiooxidans TaxID=282683 RepID=A0A1G7JR51_9RHOB|nr:MurR/RpiR family transcriptional regulator [Salipiger thiooxidans]SDF27393.1 transcriptional regulator, RpiR family [Salipiger thiooxidans]